ncbi:MAG: M6 family metalloprotease domain-containing protein [bacterium]
MKLIKGLSGFILFLLIVSCFISTVLEAMPISPNILEKQADSRFADPIIPSPPPEWIDTFEQIPAEGRMGSYNLLLVVIKFSDLPQTYSRASFDSMAFSGWPTGTIKDYYNEVSYGNLILSGQAVGWFTALNGRTYYGNGQKGWGSYPQNAARIVEEAVDAGEAAGVDFSLYDNDGDGKAESIIIVHSGEGAETSLDPNDIQSHVSTISAMGGTPRNYDGVTIDRYAICPELQSSSPPSHINIGVFCHEFGHILGLPDLYDVGRWCTSISSWGLGAFDLMAFGGWGGDVQTPSSPSHLSAWSKIQLGWLIPFEISGGSGNCTLYPVETNQQVMKLGTDGRSSEYFLIEYRDSSGFDQSLVKRGLMIYHVDDYSWTQNDCENGGSCTSGGFHYMVSIEQPDGAHDLDCGASGNYGDRGDMYPYGSLNSFTSSTNPNSNRYDGGSSGVSVTNISSHGNTMGFDYLAGSLYPVIAYDDGYYNLCYQWGANNSGFAVKMTPGKHPSLVRGLLIMSCNPYNTTFQCRLWDASGSGGTPGSPISSLHTVNNATALSWTYEDFVADSVTIESGDFWAVYIEYNGSQIASDTDSPWSGRTMTYYLGNFFADNGAYGNYMIRAVLDTLFCAGVKDVAVNQVVVEILPNPFGNETNIAFVLNNPERVEIGIYDVSGRLVRMLCSSRYPEGRHLVNWDGNDNDGARVAQGIYFYRFISESSMRSGKIGLLK